MSVKRYELKTKYRGNESWDEMEESPDGMYVRYEDYAESQSEFRAADATIENLQMQVEKLAAENAGLKAAIETHKHGFVRCNCCGDELMCHTDDVCRALDDTPATDAFLAEVRASAIDSLVDIKTKQLADMHPDTHAFGATAMTIRSQINELQMFAAQLRKGVQS